MTLDSGRVLALLGIVLLAVLAVGVGQALVYKQVQKLQPQVVVQRVVVVATPTVEPTATPAAILRLPLKSTTK